MRYRVDALEGALLDAAVAKAEGHNFRVLSEAESPIGREVLVAWPEHHAEPRSHREFEPSADWADGGPIIARELIFFSELPMHEGGPEVMVARCGRAEGRGRGHLESGMRAYVASRFGEFVELP